jgi:hypothetical protein
MMPAQARTLLVGPDEALKVPSAAAGVAADGDTIEIAPQEGGYFDCAIWRASRLTIEGRGPGVVITDKTCEGKALFVISGDDVTVRNLTLQRARVPDNNGAGIREEGENLTIESCRFLNNQSGILAVSSPRSTITIRDSEFVNNGRCEPCVHSVMVDRVAALNILRSRFRAGSGGDYVRSLAHVTSLEANEMIDGPDGISVHLVELPGGGSLVMRDNALERGPRSHADLAAVSIMAASGALPVDRISFTHNRFENDTGGTVVVLQNWTGASAELADNTLGANTVAVSTRGYWWFQAKSKIRQTLDSSKYWLSVGRSALKMLLERVRG